MSIIPALSLNCRQINELNSGTVLSLPEGFYGYQRSESVKVVILDVCRQNIKHLTIWGEDTSAT